MRSAADLARAGVPARLASAGFRLGFGFGWLGFRPGFRPGFRFDSKSDLDLARLDLDCGWIWLSFTRILLGFRLDLV